MTTLFLTIAIVHFMALVSPGPDFLFVSQTAISHRRRDALWGVVGITLGVAVWAVLALLGWHVVLEKMAWLRRILVVCGGLYLCWMGVQLLRSAWRVRTIEYVNESSAIESAPTNDHTFLRGLFTNLANPKALVYFGSVFSLLVNDDMDAAFRVSLLTLIVVETAVWFTFVALVFATPFIRARYQQLKRVIDSVAGALFLGFGVFLIAGNK